MASINQIRETIKRVISKSSDQQVRDLAEAVDQLCSICTAIEIKADTGIHEAKQAKLSKSKG